MSDNLLIKFQKLPDAQKARASDPASMRTLDSLERQYGVNLAELVMRVMVQDVEPAKLDEVLASQYHVAPEKAKELGKHMLDDLFFAHGLLDVPDVKDTLANVAAPPLAPQAGATPYLVHPDDAKDVQPHVTALQSAPAPVVDTDPTHVAQKLEKMENLQLDDFTRKRFQKIIEARLVDVRDHVETKEMLMRPQKIGGMGFDEPRADRVVRELDMTVEELHRRPKPVVPRPVPPKPQPAPAQSKPVVPAPVVQPRPAFTAPVKPIGVKPLAAPGPGAKTVVAPPPWFRPANVPPARPAAPPPPPVPRAPVRPRVVPAATPSYRDVVTDVRAPVQVMGPVEVLGNLTIDDFRRLGGTPQACVAKIAEEVEALGQDSFAQRAAGISAFRQSPVFRAYLTTGQLAMERKEEIQEVAELLRAQGKPALTQAEFEAIGQLMRQFRY